MNNNAQSVEAIALYSEEHQYGIKQLHTLQMLLRLLQRSPADAITHDVAINFAAHAGDLIALAIESLSNPIQK